MNPAPSDRKIAIISGCLYHSAQEFIEANKDKLPAYEINAKLKKYFKLQLKLNPTSKYFKHQGFKERYRRLFKKGNYEGLKKLCAEYNMEIGWGPAESELETAPTYNPKAVYDESDEVQEVQQGPL